MNSVTPDSQISSSFKYDLINTKPTGKLSLMSNIKELILLINKEVN